MPCEDSSAEIIVTLDSNECLVSYQYEKMTCGKNIGIGGLYGSLVYGKSADYLSDLSFEQVLKKCTVADKDEEFLLYLEWKALREAIRGYIGKSMEKESARYKIAEIIAGEGEVTIKMIICPPGDLPEIIPCGEKGPINT
ncbi:MAG: hypothetical protein RQ824_02835 [bacterium]|nr:hypothetical protein [bacterium]